MEFELCCDCDEPTGRAGASDDSIYSSEGAGPFCPDCWNEGHAIDKRNARITTLEAALAEREGEVALFRALLERASACLDLRSWRHLYDEIEATLTPAPKPEGEEKTHE